MNPDELELFLAEPCQGHHTFCWTMRAWACWQTSLLQCLSHFGAQLEPKDRRKITKVDLCESSSEWAPVPTNHNTAPEIPTGKYDGMVDVFGIGVTCQTEKCELTCDNYKKMPTCNSSFMCFLRCAQEICVFTSFALHYHHTSSFASGLLYWLFCPPFFSYLIPRPAPSQSYLFGYCWYCYFLQLCIMIYCVMIYIYICIYRI